MERMAFVSRHKPTEDQIRLASEKEFELIHIGDADAFEVCAADIHQKGEFTAVAVVHPAAALNLCADFTVGVFKNINRAPVGEKPQFKCEGLHIWCRR